MANPFEGLDPDAMLRELHKQAEELETRATELRADLAGASATVTSQDGAVTVTLSSTGALEDISFSAKAANVRPEALGPLVMKTVRAAQLRVSERVGAALDSRVGDQATTDFIAQFMAKPDTPPTRPPRDPDGDFDGGVLRKRQGRRGEA